MEEKDNIEKIEDQIKGLQDNEKDEYEKHLDQILEVEEDLEESTKKIDKIDDLKEVEEVSLEENESDYEEIDSFDDKVEEKRKIEEKTENTHDSKISTNSNKSSKKSSKKMIIIFLFALCFLVLLCIFLLIIFYGNKKNKNQKTVDEVTYTRSEQKEILNKFGDSVKGILAVYAEKKDVLLEYEDAVKLVNFDYKVDCKVHEIYDDGNLYLNNCSINKYKSSLSYGKKQEKKELKISEDAIKVYVSKTNKKATLRAPKNLDNYQIYGVEIKDAYTDLMLLGEDSLFLYYTTNSSNDFKGNIVNYMTGRPALEGINYQSILPIKLKSGYDLEYAAVKIDNKWGVFQLLNGIQAVQPVYDSIGSKLEVGTYGNLPYVYGVGTSFISTYYYSRGDYTSHYGLYDYRKGYYVISDNKTYMIKSGDYLWVVDEYEMGHIYDFNGNEILANTYSAILGIVDGKYILVNDRGSIKLIGVHGGVYFDYGKYNLYKKSNYSINYNNGALFQFTNPKREINPDYDGKTDCIQVVYDSNDKTGELKEVGCGIIG